jgi:hypothetical protein
MLGQGVDDLALALVTPLNSHDHDCRHRLSFLAGRGATDSSRFLAVS